MATNTDSDTYDLKVPVGTIYITPDGNHVGLAGYDENPKRPLEHADFGAMQHISGLIRQESANR
jgi:tRNA(Arg) A34 adenosine deaminase TadA